MGKTIDIRICTGTTCYVMGASDLLTLEEQLPEELKEHIRISGSTCLGYCKTETDDNKNTVLRKPPFVEVCGKLIEQATIEKIIEAAEKELSGAEHADNK